MKRQLHIFPGNIIPIRFSFIGSIRIICLIIVLKTTRFINSAGENYFFLISIQLCPENRTCGSLI